MTTASCALPTREKTKQNQNKSRKKKQNEDRRHVQCDSRPDVYKFVIDASSNCDIAFHREHNGRREGRKKNCERENLPWPQKSLILVSESHRAVAIEMERHCIWIGRFEVAEEVVTRRCQAVRTADDLRYTQFLRCLRNRLVNHSQHFDHFTNNSLHMKKKRSKLKKKKKKVHAWCFIGLAGNR
jgi:hypothetical protein